MWSTTLARLRASQPKYRRTSTQAVKTSRDLPLPDFVERTLALGPKYATEPNKSVPELVSIARRVAKGVPVGERDSLVNECVRVVSRKKPVMTHLPIRQVQQFMRDNSLCALPADKTGGFVVLTEGYSVSRCWDKDRVMAPDIDAATDLLKQSRVWDIVKPHMDHYFTVQEEETRMPSPTTSEISVASSSKKRRVDNHDY
ncbi:hypothetical protein HPB50_015664 [Hyalomma asiaticum]|uniref:Uncharacterized protein n=1 Tax=Hyalomma asiaticum TaxID=266040 RepID=A0ACB7TL45_HYAAI|nr:hypothetical protein HPB50_015664 [Hyalomma asiaticum]